MEGRTAARVMTKEALLETNADVRSTAMIFLTRETGLCVLAHLADRMGDFAHEAAVSGPSPPSGEGNGCRVVRHDGVWGEDWPTR